jgi:predicted dehydrogenase
MSLGVVEIFYGRVSFTLGCPYEPLSWGEKSQSFGMSDLQTPIGVALIGTGFGQKVHLPALKDCPYTQVVAVYHRDRTKAEAIAHAHQIPQAADNLEMLLALPDVQAVCISTPPFLHSEMAQQALRAGKHVFLEKPTAMDVTEAKAIYQQSQQQSLQTTLNFEFRFIPAWMALKAQLEAFYVGKPRLIKIDWMALKAQLEAGVIKSGIFLKIFP